MFRKLLLVLVFAGLLSLGATVTIPFTYYVKIIDLAGANVAAPLEIASATPTQNVYVPGQHKPSEATIQLQNSRGQPHLRATYALLKKMQRVEIYENPDLLGDPDWTGFLKRKTRGLSGNQQWQCIGVEGLLDVRHLRQYHRLTGNAATVATGLLKTYQTIFSDDFNVNPSGPPLTDWVYTPVLVTAVNGQILIQNDHSAPNLTTFNGGAYVIGTATQWKNSKFSFDISIPTDTYSAIDFWYSLATDTKFRLVVSQFQTDPATDGQFVLYAINLSVPTTLASRSMSFEPNTMNHIDIYTESVPTGHRIIVTMNGSEVFNVIDTTSAAWAHSGRILFYDAMGTTVASASDYIYLDNVILATATSVLTTGNIDATTDTIDQVFNGDSQLAALEWICDQEGWEYRIRPKAGAGNDIIDIGAQVGVDMTVITLEDGTNEGGKANISSLNVDDMNEELATQLTTYGQSRDDVTTSFISTDIAKMLVYGIVESEYHDERAVDSTTAKAIGDVRVARLSAADIAIQGRVLDESSLLEQDPKWGYAIWGDAIWGGRFRFRAGDLVWIKSNDFGLDKQIEFVSITRRTGDIGFDFVADYHMYRASDANRNLKRQVDQLKRALVQRIDTQTIVFTLVGAVTETLSFNMRGNRYRVVYFDVTSAAWGTATPIFFLDGVDRTLALFGAANIFANAFAIDTQFLTSAGVHTISITTNSTVTLTVGIRPALMG